ncbi:hypothetical protein TSOC_003005 [Tetrabaena socialis]|uniref:Uncharacterized protein n=1 Tax=Tetrabaena socialis TaxID=47790 RepID=A0A2J8ACR1_9CHLO|nr:hypothetical protein TSOC_003005 [Tetrabaena socialis]|eukprot:PNH10297.1 hypothetical protein TSOC_003005 [Tetrabaena socialis]
MQVLKHYEGSSASCPGCHQALGVARAVVRLLERRRLPLHGAAAAHVRQHSVKQVPQLQRARGPGGGGGGAAGAAALVAAELVVVRGADGGGGGGGRQRRRKGAAADAAGQGQRAAAAPPPRGEGPGTLGTSCGTEESGVVRERMLCDRSARMCERMSPDSAAAITLSTSPPPPPPPTWRRPSGMPAAEDEAAPAPAQPASTSPCPWCSGMGKPEPEPGAGPGAGPGTGMRKSRPPRPLRCGPAPGCQTH